jgi:hypothetical protein
MGQITIYLDKETEEKMRAILRATGLSRSRWVADLIREKLQSEWPDSIIALAGAWQDFPSAEEIRAGLGQDMSREPV